MDEQPGDEVFNVAVLEESVTDLEGLWLYYYTITVDHFPLI